MEKKYLITGVDPMLYKNFKAACAYYELTEKEVFIKHMRNIVEDYNNTLLDRKVKAHQKKKGVKKK